ncbi:MAG: hypothetical protein AB7S70_12665 [Hyphomicrobium sp.]|uniref:hypothetical protein n=1 Tax=Hyphomicrobium sp. TaxID=82 RepID=UPI003D1236B5
MCPCGSGKLFQALLHEERQARRLRARVLPPRRLMRLRRNKQKAPHVCGAFEIPAVDEPAATP